MRKTISQIKAIVNNGKVTLNWYQSTPLFKTEHTTEFDNFRIFRKATDFVFGEDYEEYFLNLSSDDATLIFDGPLPAGNHRKYVFEDTSVEFRQTYAFFCANANFATNRADFGAGAGSRGLVVVRDDFVPAKRALRKIQ